jgi:hypothetical protein
MRNGLERAATPIPARDEEDRPDLGDPSVKDAAAVADALAAALLLYQVLGIRLEP